MKKSKKKIILISTSVFLLIAAVSVFFIQRQIETKKLEQLQAAEQERKYPVRTALSTSGDISDFIKINGSVSAEKSVDINPDTGGRLKSLLVDVGDYVKKGKIIAEVDPSKPGLSYTSSPVRSTIEGTVTALPAEVGSNLTSASIVATIGDLSLLQIETEIPEPKISKIKMGAESLVSFAAYPDKKYPAHIVEISPVVDPMTRTMKIKLEFSADHSEIKAGMFGSIKLYTETRKNVIKIPSSSLVIRDGKDTVFIVKNGNIVTKVNVEIGIVSDGIAEIMNGMSSGDVVVISGQTLLEDGVQIKDLGKDSNADIGNGEEN